METGYLHCFKVFLHEIFTDFEGESGHFQPGRCHLHHVINVIKIEGGTNDIMGLLSYTEKDSVTAEVFLLKMSCLAKLRQVCAS